MAKQLRMVRPYLEGLSELEISEGYEIRTYQDDDDVYVYWANIISAAFGRTRTAEDFP